ncbi:hypothetical protein Ahy_A04g021441 isoform C [Arachis hypogaea]|uniref:BUB1 N-terminal domain-containing protein n=1 Tax=Arachis hypogaea TaxID=3818 RepID=A0A445DKA9_ARAHY|nr:hypothetical protein Ahy_A04g021441 isoform C [Arachis hypogaea]
MTGLISRLRSDFKNLPEIKLDTQFHTTAKFKIWNFRASLSYWIPYSDCLRLHTRLLAIRKSIAFLSQSPNSNSMVTFFNSLTSATASATDDPLLPFLWSVKKALEGSGGSSQNLLNLLGDCIRSFKDSEQYRNDVRFLKIWLLYMGVSSDFGSVFMEMLNCNVCTKNASLYVWSACFFELKGRLHDALTIYHLGISRLIIRDPQSWETLALIHGIPPFWKT